MVILGACRINILLQYKKRQQAFLAPLSGKQLAKDIVNSLINFTSLSPLILAGLPLLSLSFFTVAEQCMTGFDLPNNFNPNPERIGRIVRRRVIPPQKRLTWPITSPSTSASSPMAQKSLRQFSAPYSSHMPAGLNQEQAGNDSFELKTGLVNTV